MGTRNLTIVKLDGEYRIAQYGQWDGYPSGNGDKVLKFLAGFDRPVFEDKLRGVTFLSDRDIDEINAIIEKNSGGEPWQKRWPELSRDMGAGILEFVQRADKGVKLKNSLDFAADSLFCEWAYVIDLDTNMLEVYKGFNTTPLEPSDRFYGYKDDNLHRSKEYQPVKLVHAYSLDALPDTGKLVADCDPSESEE